MPDSSANHDTIHPFQTPAAERLFKALLWVVLLLQIAVFARMYNRVVDNLPERASAPAWQAG